MKPHTPGPWTAIPDSQDGEDSEGDWYILTEGEAAIAVGLYGPDARLIAAAPDLLAALREAQKVTKFHNPQIDAVVRAAIAKAEGDL